ncbi:hypothetical protein DXG01_000530 [Tephrocybe rancida]|nr:hypothetical protein DXG01_000530 [Tephrocybe rancida]
MGSEPPHSPLTQQPGAVIKPTGTGMTPASRYQHNLKVLRRRDPSISSIFNQFSHVCLYHHNGTKWEKQGFEGSMFLYERESYPPYGFYILNRMGMDDHIQRLYPEDNIGAHKNYLIIRSYPEYTDRRLAVVRASHNIATLDKYSNAYAIPNINTLSVNEKGEAKTIGLWMFATDSREPLIDIFTRLHSYIKRNQPYPQEFRYGPDRPPPSIPASVTPATNRSQANGHATLPPTPSNAGFPASPGPRQEQFQAHHPSHTTANGGLSELDKLFAKMEPTPLLAHAQVATPTQYPTSTLTSNMSVQSLLAGLGGGNRRQSVSAVVSPPSSASTTTGLSLLDSIFASASNNALPIHTPAPTSTSPPQILDQTTISTLLGIPPSRTASAASTAYSTDARSSHSSSREGDNEDDDTSDYGYGRSGMSDGYSESSTVLDPDAEYDDELQAAGASAGRPLLAEPAANGHGNGNGRINGDVTPRPPMNGFITPPFGRQPRPASVLDPASVAGRRQQPRQQQQQSQHQHPERTPRAPLGSERKLVPFEPDSELWPYNSHTVTNNYNHNHNHNEQSAPSDDEIIELDFADTSALSDPDVFRARQRANGHGHTNGNGVEKPEKRTRTKRKQGKKDRVAEQAKKREEIERSWDVPANNVGAVEGMYQAPPSPASPSPCPSPEPTRVHANGVASGSSSVRQNGIINAAGLRKEGEPVPSGVTKGKGKAKTQTILPRDDFAKDGSHEWLDDDMPFIIKNAANSIPQMRRAYVGEAVKDTMVAGVVAKERSRPRRPAMEKNDFLREMLTLIQTDDAFADSLYKAYTTLVESRSG